MFYQFPRIQTIHDVLPHIEGRDEFVVAKRDFYTVINYNVIFTDTFPEVNDLTSAVRRECRGIVFRNDNGRILSRRLHKFFNLNERPETQSNIVIANQLDIPYGFFDKRDGSMVTPLVDPDGFYVHWATKMGVTDTSKEVTKFVNGSKIAYTQFAMMMYMEGLTPIFEYTSPTNRIVVSYDKPELVLLHIRDNITGEYMNRRIVEWYAEKFDIPTVNIWRNPPVFRVDDFMETINKISNIEGYVLTFSNGHMVKMKTEEYRSIHKAKDQITLEKNLVKVIIEDSIDDLLPHMPEEDYRKIIELRDKVNQGIVMKAWVLVDFVENYKDKNPSEFAPYAKNMGIFSGIVFKLHRSENNIEHATDELKKLMLKYVNTSTKLDMIRHIWE